MSNLVFDIETNGLTPDEIFCIVAADVDTGEVYTFDDTQLEEGYNLLKAATKLIGHNVLCFDLPVIKDIAGVDLFDKKIVDTLVLSRLFNPTREGKHNLEGWGYRLGFLKGGYGKKEEAFASYNPKMLEYCKRDVMLNVRVYNVLRQESRGFTPLSVQIEHATARIVDQQKINGFMLNERKANFLVAQFEERLFKIKEEVHKEFIATVTTQILTPQFIKSGELSKIAKDQHGKGVRLTEAEYRTLLKGSGTRETHKEFNLGSRKQIGEYLIAFGWKPTSFTPTGQPSIDEKILSKVKDIPQALIIAEYLMLQKRLAQVNSWLEAVDADGRVRGYVNPNGAVTSRMTHSHPNMAQIPSSTSPHGVACRSCWVVPEGYSLVGIDASGLELRMLAHYLNDEDYTNEILNGDIHTTNQNLAGLKSRDQAKTFIYALLYGAGDGKLGAVAGGNRTLGKSLRKSFFDNLAPFKSLTSRVQREAKSGFIKAIDGRKLAVRYPHAALNTLLQGAGAIVMKQALIILESEIKAHGWDAKFVANVHDEWQIECGSNDAKAVGQAGVEAIKEAGRIFKLNCPLDGDYKVGESWNETH